MRRLFALLALVGGLVAGAGMASAAEPPPDPRAQTALSPPGLPLLQSFTAKEMGAAAQNWSVVQDPRGVMYVGNVYDGVLEYDGARWRRIPIPNHSTVRSLAVDRSGRVYVGAQSEVGYLAPDATGTLHYVSLMDRIPEPERDFVDVWRIAATDHGVYFFTANRLFRYHEERMHSWASEMPFLFQVGQRVFVRHPEQGLLEPDGDRLVPVPGASELKGQRLYAVVEWPASSTAGDGLLVGSRSRGFEWIARGRSQAWATDADGFLKDALAYNAQVLNDRALAVGTLQGGVTVLDAQGRETLRLGRAQGLGDAVYDMRVDDQRGLWLALGTGLARVEVDRPLTRFDARSGLNGTATTLGRQGGAWYVGTTQGLYRLDATGVVPSFSAVPAVNGAVWELLEVDDALLVGHMAGLHAVRGNAVDTVRLSNAYATGLLRSRRDPARVFMGTSLGIGSVRRQGGRWIDEGDWLKLDQGVYTMMEDAQGRLWVGTASEKLFRLTFEPGDGGPPKPRRVESFGPADGLPPGLNNVHTVGGLPVFATPKGVMRFDEAARRFVPHPDFDGLFPEGPPRVDRILEDAQRRVWMDIQDDGGSKRTGAAVPQPDGRYRWDGQTLASIEGTMNAPLRADPDGVVWFGGDDGLYRLDTRRPTNFQRPYAALIRRVVGRNDRVLYGGAGDEPPPTLAYAENSLRIEFAAPSYDAPQATRYRTMLEGMETAWSSWNETPHFNFTNIPEGHYRFRVQAKNVYGVLSREGVYEFRILPPWYRTWWAYLSYLLSAAGLFWAISRWRSQALRRRNRELAALVERRTGELSEAVGALREQSLTDPLTGLRNRRYVLDHIAGDIARVDRAYAERPDGERPENADLLFLLVDIDHFKEINDRHGHAAGDRVLQQIRDLLLSVCRKADTAVRWGGEEFLVIARGVEAEAGAHLAERIRSAVANHEFDLGSGETLYRTCSIGFAAYPFFRAAPQRLGWEQVIELADQCLYEAKRGGRNMWIGARGAIAQPPLDIEARLHAGVRSMEADGLIELAAFGEG